MEDIICKDDINKYPMHREISAVCPNIMPVNNTPAEHSK